MYWDKYNMLRSILPVSFNFLFLLTWLLEKFKLHVWFLVIAPIIFLLDDVNLEAYFLEFKRIQKL